MRAVALRSLVTTAGLLAGPAGAASLGEISLHSRIGEELLAEIPFTAGDRELSDAACFSLQALPGADLPVVSNARIRLVRDKNGAHLLLIGNRPLNEPAFTLSLRVNCGVDLQRTYVLMPDAPLPNSATAQPRLAERNVARADERAATPRPAPPSRTVHQEKSGKTAARRPATRRQLATTAPRPAAQSQQAANSLANQGDRLVLGTTPLEFGTGDNIPAAGSKLGELEQRVLKMETSLSSLNQEMDALHSSLTLSTEMQAAKRELQMAQTLQQPTLAAAAPVVPEKRTSSANDWLQLLLSMLLGGLLTASLAHLATRRRPLGTSAGR